MNRGARLYVVTDANSGSYDDVILEVFYNKSDAKSFKDQNSKLEMLECWCHRKVKEKVVVTINHRYLCVVDVHSNMYDAQLRIDNDAIIMWKTIR